MVAWSDLEYPDVEMTAEGSILLPVADEVVLGIGEGIDTDVVIPWQARLGTLSCLDVAYWASINIDPLPPWLTPGDPTGDLDGSELVEWAAAQVGVTVVGTLDWLAANLEPVTVAEALRARGAVLLNSTRAAVSLGFRTVSMVDGDRYVLRAVPDDDSTWTAAGLIPGVMYL